MNEKKETDQEAEDTQDDPLIPDPDTIAVRIAVFGTILSLCISELRRDIDASAKQSEQFEFTSRIDSEKLILWLADAVAAPYKGSGVQQHAGEMVKAFKDMTEAFDSRSEKSDQEFQTTIQQISRKLGIPAIAFDMPRAPEPGSHGMIHMSEDMEKIARCKHQSLKYYLGMEDVPEDTNGLDFQKCKVKGHDDLIRCPECEGVFDLKKVREGSIWTS